MDQRKLEEGEEEGYNKPFRKRFPNELLRKVPKTENKALKVK